MLPHIAHYTTPHLSMALLAAAAAAAEGKKRCRPPAAATEAAAAGSDGGTQGRKGRRRRRGLFSQHFSERAPEEDTGEGKAEGAPTFVIFGRLPLLPPFSLSFYTMVVSLSLSLTLSLSLSFLASV